jgi:hypothetical protein
MEDAGGSRCSSGEVGTEGLCNPYLLSPYGR